MRTISDANHTIEDAGAVGSHHIYDDDIHCHEGGINVGGINGHHSILDKQLEQDLNGHSSKSNKTEPISVALAIKYKGQSLKICDSGDMTRQAPI